MKKITRRQFLAGSTAAVIGGVLPLLYRSSKNKPPNIVFFLADDLRYDTLGYAGNAIIQTPSIDALAKESVVFNNCFVTTSICPVSRASILTGQYMETHGVRDFGTPLQPGVVEKTFPVRMREHGYFTGFVGKWGIGRRGDLPADKFDFWRGFPGLGHYYERSDPSSHLNDRQNDEIQEFFQELPADQSFLLIVYFKAPHVPMLPQERFKHLYENVPIPRHKVDATQAVTADSDILDRTSLHRRYGSEMGTDKEYQEYMRNYYRLVTGMDEVVGNTLATLKDMGRYNDSCIIFSSDNGQMLGEHGMVGKTQMFEESIRIPLTVRLPAAMREKASRPTADELVLNIDFAPTILEMAGLSVPGSVQGRSLVGLFDRQHSWREDFLYTFPLRTGRPNVYGVRGKKWKYSINSFAEAEAGEDLLFDMENDPDERNNLAADPDYASIVEELRQRTETLFHEAGGKGDIGKVVKRRKKHNKLDT